MGSKNATLITAFLFQLLLYFSQSSGEPNYYRTYRILSGVRSPYYTDYNTYNNNPALVDYYPSRYKYSSSPLYDDKVYITDRYGNTIAKSSNEYSRSIQSGSYRTTGYCENCPSGYYREAEPASSSNYATYCEANTCGRNAQCQIIGGRPVCSCLKGHSGDPLSVCTRSECLSAAECRGHLTCQNGRCVDPCAGTCGINADCQARNHVPVCSCPPGYTGNPFTSCRRFDPSELCHPSPCGPNTNCEVVNEVPTCKCRPGFLGSPIAGCRHECESDGECNSNQACIDFRCQNPCSTQCGQNADCAVRNHQAICTCPKNYFGNPLISCKPECYGDVDCPPGRPACFYGICKSPCDGVCGIGADCNLRGLTPVCSCPKDMTGNPFVSCRPFEARDLCEPNPCGTNAYCEPGFETRNPAKERPVCFCQTGYLGNPVTGCRRGECLTDGDCSTNRACIEYTCQNPCVGQCGVNAECNPRNHLAVCTCPSGYQGDALTVCHLQQGEAASSRYVYRYKRNSTLYIDDAVPQVQKVTNGTGGPYKI